MTDNIKLVIADFDGTLCSLRDVHYTALNQALAEVAPQCTITPEEHVSTFDGLSTRKKLELLSTTKGLPTDTHACVHERKQALTLEAIESQVKPDLRLQSLLQTLRDRGYITVLASNAVFPTIQAGLMATGLWKLFDRIYSNTDCVKQKPHPEIYLRVMSDFGVAPDQTLIIEDSKHGREAAYRSGAYVCGVDNPEDLTITKVETALACAKPKPKRWVGGSVNVVIPMSGLGSRFTAAGYTLPKPLIDVAGKPMIQRVVENLPIDAHFTFIVQQAHYDGYYLGTLLNAIAPGCTIIPIDGQTQGAVCTVLKAIEQIHNDEHLIIANSDQWVDWDVCSFMWSMIGGDVDGGILTFTDTNPKWSFAREEGGYVVEVAEKRAISDQATVGVYYWKRGRDFVEFAKQMIAKDVRVNGEFYVAPVFQQAIDAGKKVKTFKANRMVGMGTPEDLQAALASGVFDA